jgi:oxygen-dependent protoporphyrinogen oxidase
VLAPIDPELASVFGEVPYAPILVAAVSLGEAQLKAPLNGFGFLVPRIEGPHILGTLFNSSLFPNRAPEGRVLLTCFLGGATEPEAVQWSDERVWETVESELKQILGFEGDAKPLALFRYPRAIPQYGLGQPRWREDVMERMAVQPGLFLAGNYLNGVSVPASIAQGQRTGNAVIDYVRRAS